MADKDLKNQLDGLFSSMDDLFSDAQPQADAESNETLAELATEAKAPKSRPKSKFKQITEPENLDEDAQILLERRARQVQLSTEVAQDIAVTPALGTLFNRVVTLVQEKFGYYHVHIYTLEADVLVMQEGTGTVGRQLKEADHKIPLEAAKSLVARAARNGEVVVIPDVSQEPGWLPNPLLPETKSELAVPIRLKDTILGVLDIQENVTGGLGEEARILMLGLCGQIAVAINNHRIEAERKEAEARLRENENRLKLITDSVQSGIVIIDAETRQIIEANPAAIRMIGAEPGEVVGSVCHRFICPAEVGKCPVCDLGQTVDNSERVLLTNRGEAIPIIKNVVEVMLEGRRCLVENFMSIADRKEAEVELSRFKLGIERSADAVFMTNVEGEIIYVNAAFEALYGYTFEEVKQNTPRLLKSGQTSQEEYEKIWNILLSKETVSGEIVNKTKDGRLITVERRNNPILDDDGELIGFLATHHDITARKKTQAILAKRAAELETVAKVGTVASTILETEKLLQAVVGLTKEQFGLYHAHVYLYDVSTNGLKLAAGAGNIGQQMVKAGWTIAIDHPHSLVARAARKRQGIIVNDVQLSSEYLSNPLLPHTRSELAVPLMGGIRMLGVLDVQSDQVDYFTEDDLRIQSTLAAQVSVALQNTYLFKEAEVALKQAETLAKEQAELTKLGQTLAPILTVDEVLAASYPVAARLLGVSEVLIGLYDSNKHQITFDQPEDGSEPFVMSADQGISGYIIRTGESVLFKEDGAEWLEAHGIEEVGQSSQSWVGAPLRIGEQILGVIFTQSWDTPGVFNEHDRDLLTAIAGQIAISVQNAYLFQETKVALAETQTLAREREVLNELGRSLTARLNVQQVLEETYHQVSRLLDTTNFYFGLYDHAKNQIRFTFNITESELDKQIDVIPADEGLAGYIIKNRKSLLLEDDVRRKQEELGIPLVGEEASSWLGVPLIFGEQILGVLALQSYTTPGVYNEHSRDLLNAIASQVAVSLNNASQFEDVAKARKDVEGRLRETQSLQRFSQSLAGELQTDKILEVFFNACINIIGFEYVDFSTVDKDQRWIKTIGGVGISQKKLQHPGHSLDSDDIKADIIRTGKTEIISGWDNRFDKAIFEAEGHADWVRVFVPVVLRQDRVGLVEAGYNNSKSSTIDDIQIQLLRSFIDQTSLALENAQRYEASRKAARREQVIREITEKMRSASSLDDLVKTTAKELGQRLSAGHVILDFGLDTHPASDGSEITDGSRRG